MDEKPDKKEEAEENVVDAAIGENVKDPSMSPIESDQSESFEKVITSHFLFFQEIGEKNEKGARKKEENYTKKGKRP